MPDLAAISTEELYRMHDAAYAEYYRQATRPVGNWKKGMKFPELEKATEKLDKIDIEILRRIRG